MKKFLLSGVALTMLCSAPALAADLPVKAPVRAPVAQLWHWTGCYIGIEGGLNWMLNTTILGVNTTPQLGFAAGAVAGYDFVGPRVELEVVYRQNNANANFGGRAIESNGIGQIAPMVNLF